jgi:thioredoxin 1
MAAPHFNKDTFEKTINSSDKPVLIDFYAQWCGPCQIASPIIDNLAEEYEGKVIVGKIDVDEAPEVASEYGVMSIPTMVIFKQGKEVERKIGFPGESGLRNWVESISK